MIRIEPYKPGSKGAKALSRRLGVLRVTPKQIRQHGTFPILINWGSSERRFADAQYINDPAAVAIAADKIQAFEAFHAAGVPAPASTTSREQAWDWLTGGSTVVARTLTRASAGRGLTLIHPEAVADAGGGIEEAQQILHAESSGDRGGVDSDGRGARVRAAVPAGGGNGGDGGDGRRLLIDAPLYTQYVKKAREYRVHVCNGAVIDVQQKRKRQERENDEVDYQIRNLAGGWVYCRGGVDAPDCVLRASLDAVASLGLDFGAVDVGYNENRGQACVYEVNTAPGIEGSTLDRYYEAISELLPQLQSGAYQRRRAA
jgi:hypothetical protein